MNKHIFRGKKKTDNQWIEGSLIQWPNGQAQIVVPAFEYGKMVAHAVIPESTGKFIGVKGYTGEYQTRKENEVMLWEGDIVEARSEGSVGIFVITWGQQSAPRFYLWPAWQKRAMWNIHASDTGRAPEDYYDDLRLLGNIHDNPELIPKIQP